MSKRNKAASGLGRAKILAGPLVTMACVPALASPTNPQVVHGTANFQVNGEVTTITTSHQAIINYQAFSIGAGQTVEFVQPGANSTVLNRVMGDDPSRIDGSLIANGIVYLVNPAGITFGNGALVNVGQLYAAAGNISNEDFLQGVRRFELTGTVRNEGVINADFVGLLGVRVENTGQIIAKDAIALAAGDDIYIGERGSRVYLKTNGANRDGSGGIMNSGDLLATGGQVIAGVGDMYGIVLHDASRIEAELIAMRAGVLEVRGEMIARGGDGAALAQGEGERGGTIHLLGDRIAVHEATIDASGRDGGGEIRIGGDIQGQGDLETASRTYVSEGTVLLADAIERGHGGTIVVWADEITGYAGHLSVRGGAEWGDGGFAEVSGKQTLIFRGTADVGSSFGSGGTLLLDPDNIVIEDGAGGPSDDPVGSLLDGVFDDNDAMGDVTLSQNFLESFSGGNLLLVANDSITINNLTSNSLNFQSVTGTTITFTANANGLGTANTNGGAFTMDASDTIATAGAGVTINAATIDLGGIASSGGAVNLFAVDGITINNAVNTGGGMFNGSANGDGDNTGTFAVGASGSITTGGGSVTIAGEDWDIAGAINAGSGDVNFNLERLGSQSVSIGDTSGAASLGQAELDLITTSGTFRVGAGGTSPTSVAISDFDLSGSGGTNTITGNVEIRSGGNITVNSGVGETSIFERGLTLTADGAVTFGANGSVTINNSGSTDALRITTDADGNDPNSISDLLIFTAQANMVTNGGDVVINTPDIELPAFSSIDAGAGSVSITRSGGDIGLGADNGEDLVLDAGELGRITAGNFLVGVTATGFQAVSSVTVSADLPGTITGDVTIAADGVNGAVFFNSAFNAPGSLTVRGADGVTINAAVAAMGPIVINANTDNIADGGTLTFNVSGSIDSNGSNIFITADDLVLNTTGDRIIAGAGDVFITHWNSAGTIGFGGAAGQMSITDAELARISGASLTVGGNGALTDPLGATLASVGSIALNGATFSAITGPVTLNALGSGTSSIAFSGGASSTPGAVNLNANNGISFAGSLTSGGIVSANADFNGSGSGVFSTTGGTVNAGSSGIRIIAGDVDLASGGLTTTGNVAISASDSAATMLVGSEGAGFSLGSGDLANITALSLAIGGGIVNADALAVTQVSTIVVDGIADGSLDGISGAVSLLAQQANGTITFSGGASTIDRPLNAFADNGITVSTNVLLEGAGVFNADFDTSGAGSFVVNDGVTLTGLSSISILAHDMTLAGASGTRLSAPTVTINNSDFGNASQTIGLGGSSGTLSLTGTELARITATTLTFGQNAGGIIVNGLDQATSLANVGTVVLNTAGSLLFEGADTTFSALVTIIDDGITIDGVDVTITATTTLNADNDLDGGVFSIINGGSLEVTSGNITILASDIDWEDAAGVTITSGSLTISNAQSGGSIDLGNNPNGGSVMHLSNAELALITGNTLNIGSVANPTTNIVVDGVTAGSLMGINAVVLTATAGSSGTVSFINNASTIDSPLTVRADAGVTIATTLTTTDAITLIGDFDNNSGAGDDVTISGALNAGGNVVITGADFNLSGTLDATGFDVLLAPSTATEAFVGDGVAPGFRLDSTEMAAITADTLTIGSATAGQRIDRLVVDGVAGGSDANIASGIFFNAINLGGTAEGDVEFITAQSTFDVAIEVTASDRILIDETLTVGAGSIFIADSTGVGGGDDSGVFQLSAADLNASGGLTTIVAEDYVATPGAGVTSSGDLLISQSRGASINLGADNTGAMVLSSDDLASMSVENLIIGGELTNQVATIAVDNVSAAGSFTNLTGGLTLNALAPSGQVFFINNGSSVPGALTVNGLVGVTVDGSSPLTTGGDTLFVSPSIVIGSNITLSQAGTLTFDGPTVFTSSINIETAGGVGDDVLFIQNLNDTSFALAHTIDAGMGAVDFGGTFGVGAISITAAETFVAGGTYNADGSSGNGISFSGDLILNGDSSFFVTGGNVGDDFSVGGNVIASGNRGVPIGGESLTVTSFGDVTFGGDVGSMASPLFDITITGVGVTFDGQTFADGQVEITNSGLLDINGAMTLGGAFIQNDNGGSVLLSANITTIDANITFGSELGVDGPDVLLDAGEGAISLAGGAFGGNDVTLRADAMTFSAQVDGTGTLMLEPSATDSGIDVGAFMGAGGAGILELGAATIAQLSSNFAEVIIGYSTGTHNIRIGDATFASATTFNAPLGGSITLLGALMGTGVSSDFTLNGSGATTFFDIDASVNTMGGDFVVNDNAIVLEGATPTIETGGGLVEINGTLQGTTGGVAETILFDTDGGTFTITGAVTGDGMGADDTGLTTVSVVDAGDTSFGGLVDISGLLTVAADVNMIDFASSIDAGLGFDITGGVVNFMSTVTSEFGGLLLANSGAATFDGDVNLNTDGSTTADFFQSTTGDINFNADVTTNDGDILIGGDVAATGVRVFDTGAGRQQYGGTFDIGGPTTFRASGDGIGTAGVIFNDAVTGSGPAGANLLIFQAATNADNFQVGGGTLDTSNVLIDNTSLSFLADGFDTIFFGYNFGTGVMEVGSINVTDPTVFLGNPNAGVFAGLTIVTGAVVGTDDASFTFSANRTEMNAGSSVTTAGGDISFFDDLVITGGGLATVTSGGGMISIGGDIFGETGGGAESLTLDAGSANLTIAGTITGDGSGADATGLADFTIANAGAVSVADVDISGDFVTTNPITGNFSASGDVLAGGQVTVNAGANQVDFNGVLVGDGGIDITGGTVNFLSTVSSAMGGLDVTNSSFAFFGDDVTIEGGNIVVTGDAVTAAGIVINSGMGFQNYGGTLDLEGTLTLRATSDGGANNGITFSDTVSPPMPGAVDDLLVIQPFDSSTAFQIGDGTIDTSNVLIDNTSLAFLLNGFDGIVFGYTFGFGQVEVGTLTVSDPTSFLGNSNSGVFAGLTTVTGTVTGTDNASFFFNANRTELNAGSSVTTDGGSIVFRELVATGGAGGATVSSNGGLIAVMGDIFGETGGGAESLTFEAGTGSVIVDGSVTGNGMGADATGLDAFTVGSADGLSLLGGVDISGALTLGSTSRITGALTLLDMTVGSLDATITGGFFNSITASDALGGTGDVSIDNTETINLLQSVIADGAFNQTNSTMSVDSEVLFGGGEVNPSIIAQGITFESIVTLVGGPGDTATFNAGANPIVFASLDANGNDALFLTNGPLDFLPFVVNSQAGVNESEIFIAPLNATDPIDVGTVTNPQGGLSIPESTFTNIDPTIFAVNIGDLFIGEHSIQIGDLTVPVNTGFFAPVGAGVILLDGSITATGNASLLFNSQIIRVLEGLSVSIATNDGDIEMTGLLTGTAGGTDESISFDLPGSTLFIGGISGDGAGTGLESVEVLNAMTVQSFGIDIALALEVGSGSRVDSFEMLDGDNDMMADTINAGGISINTVDALFGEVNVDSSLGGTGIFFIDNSGLVQFTKNVFVENAFQQANGSINPASAVEIGASEAMVTFEAGDISFASDVTLVGGSGSTAEFISGLGTVFSEGLNTSTTDTTITTATLSFNGGSNSVTTDAMAPASLVIRPLDVSGTIDVGDIVGVGGALQGGLWVSADSMAAIAPGFSFINFGYATGSEHAIQVGGLTGASAINAPATFFAEGGNGSVTFLGAIEAAGDGSITAEASGTQVVFDLDASIVTTGGAFTANGPSILMDTTSITTNGGSLRMLGSIDGGFGLTLSATDPMLPADPDALGREDFVAIFGVIGANSPLASLTIDGFDVRLGGIGTMSSSGVTGSTQVVAIDDLIFAGGLYNANQQFYAAGTEHRLAQSTLFMSNGNTIDFVGAAIELNQEFVSDTNLTIITDGGDVTIGGGITGEDDIAQVLGFGDVFIDAGSGNAQIDGPAGFVGATLNTLEIIAANILLTGANTQGSQIYTGALQTSGDYNQIDAMGGGITVNGSLDLNADSIFLTGGETGDDFRVTGEINGAFALTANAGMGDVVFLDRIGLATPLTGLTINAFDVRLSGIGSPTAPGVEGDVSVIATDDIQFARFVYNNNGTAFYSAAGDLRMFETTIFRTNGNDMTFVGSIEGRDGDESLLLDAGAGVLTFDSIGLDDFPPFTGTPSIVDVTLIASEVNFSGQLNGSGDLMIIPSMAGQDIVIGAADNDSAALDLTVSEIAGIGSDFASITIGRADGTGDFTFLGATLFGSPTTFLSPGGETNFMATSLTGIDNASFEFLTSLFIVSANGAIDAVGDITIPTTLDTLNGSENFIIESRTGAVTITGLIGGNSPFANLQIEGATISLNGVGTQMDAGVTDLFTLISSGDILLDANDYNAGAMNIDGAFIDLLASGDTRFTGDVTLNGQLSKATSGTLSFLGDLFSANVAIITTAGQDFEVTGATDGPGSLAVIVGAADAIFGGAIGANEALRALTISSNSLTILGNSITLQTDGTPGDSNGLLTIISSSMGGALSQIELGDGSDTPFVVTADRIAFSGDSAELRASGLMLDSGLAVSNVIFDDADPMTTDLVGLFMILTDDFTVTGDTLISTGLGIDMTGARARVSGDADINPDGSPNGIGDIVFMGAVDGPGGNLIIQMPDLDLDFVSADDNENALIAGQNPVINFQDSIGASSPLGIISLNESVRIDPSTFSNQTVLPTATVILGDRAFMDALVSGAESTTPDFFLSAEQFRVGFFEKINAYANVIAEVDTFRVGDMTVLGSLSVTDLMSSPDPLSIELLRRPQAFNFAFDADNGLYFADIDIGADIVVLGVQGRQAMSGSNPGSLIIQEENILLFGADPTLVDIQFINPMTMAPATLANGRFFISLPLSRGSINDSGSAITNVEVLLPLPGPNPADIRPDVSSFTGLFTLDLDLNGRGIGLNPAIARAVAVASAVELTELPEDNTVNAVQRDALRDLEILLRDDNPDVLLNLLLGYALYDDFAPVTRESDGGMMSEKYEITQDRVNFDLVQRIAELYNGLTKDADGQSRTDEIRSRMRDAVRGYLANEGITFADFRAAGFNRYVFSQPEFADVEEVILGARELIDLIKLLGVGPRVQAIAEQTILNLFFEAPITISQAREIVRLADRDLLDRINDRQPEPVIQLDGAVGE